MKACSKCKEVLHGDQFYFYAGRVCKKCRCAQSRAWQKAHSERVQELQRPRRLRPQYKQQQKGYYRQWYENRGGKDRCELHKIMHEWNRVNPEAQQARQQVTKAIRNGSIVRPLRCELCLGLVSYTGRLYAHHDDYKKPLAIRWLCASCHKYQHLTHPTPHTTTP